MTDDQLQQLEAAAALQRENAQKSVWVFAAGEPFGHGCHIDLTAVVEELRRLTQQLNSADSDREHMRKLWAERGEEIERLQLENADLRAQLGLGLGDG